MLLAVTVLASVCWVSYSTEPNSVPALSVPTTSGILVGKYSTVFNKKLKLFLGVSYADPPVGEKRFLPPTPMKEEGIEKEATHFGPSCFQPTHMDSVISPLLKPNQADISEDCLYLNVYVPDNQVGSKLPVMVWLAGEGFDYADPQQFDGSYLAVEGNVIVVTVSYRLSVFGFLSALNADAPGNVGLLDQRMALQWIKKNIANFGGDPDNVTLFGRFTGSMSAAIHAFSPLSKEEQLFNRVILQSGIPVGDWVFDSNPLNATYSIAEATKCKFPDLSKTVDCLRKIPADQLLNAAMSLPTRFRPIYDLHLAVENSFTAARKSDYAPIDLMVGINNDEGSLCSIALNAMQSPLYHKLLHNTISAADFSTLVQMNMLEFYKNQDSLLDTLANYKYSESDEHLRKRFIEFCGDVYITSRAQKLADILAEKRANVYMYEFAHRPSFSIHPEFIRAGHGDDVLYSLALPYQLPDLPEDEARLTKKMVKALTNFARSGNPNPVESESEWPRYTSDARELMTFTTFRDKTARSIIKSSHEDAVIFWNDIIPAVEARACPIHAPIASRLIVSDHSAEVTDKTLFLGTHVALPVAEYVVMGLVGASGFLIVVLVLAVGLLLKSKKSSDFHRLG